MLLKCAGCPLMCEDNALSSEGQCFSCSTGDTDCGKITTRNLRESMANVARDLSDKTNLTTKSVAQRMFMANAEAKKNRAC